jgi:hypothetical protein
MNFLKDMAIGLVGFFLFVSLSVLGLFLTLNFTILNPDFIISEAEKFDISEFARTYIKDQLSDLDQSYITALEATITQEKPWIDQQIKKSVYTTYDYLLGASDQLQFDISLGEVKENLSSNLVKSVLQSPPVEFQRLVPQDKEVYLHNLKQQIQDAIPSNYQLKINKDVIGTEGMQALQQIKEAIGYFKAAHIFLICFVVLMILLVALIERKIQGTFRELGIILLVTGAFGLISYFILKQGIPVIMQPNEFPVQVNLWLTSLITDTLSPAGMFSLIVLLVGCICLIVSLLIKKEKAVVSS